MMKKTITTIALLTMFGCRTGAPGAMDQSTTADNGESSEVQPFLTCHASQWSGIEPFDAIYIARDFPLEQIIDGSLKSYKGKGRAIGWNIGAEPDERTTIETAQLMHTTNVTPVFRIDAKTEGQFVTMTFTMDDGRVEIAKMPRAFGQVGTFENDEDVLFRCMFTRDFVMFPL